MKILCTICARGGSKGIKDKNIKCILGKPLIAYTIELAYQWKKFDEIIVSTDSEKIREISISYGASVPFIRPDELSTDETGKLDVIKHAVRFLEQKGNDYDVVIDLDVTSPLRTVDDIEQAFQKLVRSDLNVVYSVCKARKNPYFNMVEIDKYGVPYLSKKPENQVLSRQSAPKVYELNASIYVYKKEFLLNTNTLFVDKSGIYEMPEERSLDIDREIDFKFVEFMMKNSKLHANNDYKNMLFEE